MHLYDGIEVDLSRFCAAQSARFSLLAFESDGAFPSAVVAVNKTR